MRGAAGSPIALVAVSRAMPSPPQHALAALLPLQLLQGQQLRRQQPVAQKIALHVPDIESEQWHSAQTNVKQPGKSCRCRRCNRARGAATRLELHLKAVDGRAPRAAHDGRVTYQQIKCQAPRCKPRDKPGRAVRNNVCFLFK